MSELAERAVMYKHSGSNCCQAVIKALCENDEGGAALIAAGAGFAVGMGTTEATCGALCGAVMAAGLKSRGAGTLGMSKNMMKEFTQLCGASTCKELKGIATGKTLCDCDSCVKNAVTVFENAAGGLL